jgi:hypothetical protein
MKLYLSHFKIKNSGTHFFPMKEIERTISYIYITATQNTNPFSTEKDSAVTSHVTKKVFSPQVILHGPGPLKSLDLSSHGKNMAWSYI